MQRLKNKLNSTASIAIIYIVIKKKEKEKPIWEQNTGRPHRKQARYHPSSCWHYENVTLYENM
jgi:hypothetical protein